MSVLLFQLDGVLPNLALMAIARHHRGQGDAVELRQLRRKERATPDLFGNKPDRVYASLIFERTRPVARELLSLRPDAIVGGSGWTVQRTVEEFGIDGNRLDYGDYPAERRSIGFTQRGCRLNCEFCGVPAREGKVRENQTVNEIWRGEPHARELLLLDNDFFGQPHWRERIAEIRDGGFKVSFNQGINARMLNDEAAEAIASVDYRDDGMKTKRIYTAWDNRKDEATLFRGLENLTRHGVKPDHVMVYMLIGYWPGETDEDWEYRRRQLRAFGCRPYPMPYRRNALTLGFQRYCIGAFDKTISWGDWKAARCEPRNLGRSTGSMFPLPMTEGGQ